MDEFNPRMMDELTDGVTIVTRATGCMLYVNQSRDILDRIAESMAKYRHEMDLIFDPDVTVFNADALLRSMIKELAQLETVRANTDELIEILKGEYKRRIADRLQKRNLILYGVSVS